MVNLLNNTISPLKSTYSTVTNGNNFLKIHHKEPMQTSKVCFSQSIINSKLSRSELCKSGNIGPFSSGDEPVVLERNGPQNLKKMFIKTEIDSVMILCVIYLHLPFLE